MLAPVKNQSPCPHRALLEEKGSQRRRWQAVWTVSVQLWPDLWRETKAVGWWGTWGPEGATLAPGVKGLLSELQPPWEGAARKDGSQTLFCKRTWLPHILNLGLNQAFNQDNLKRYDPPWNEMCHHFKLCKSFHGDWSPGSPLISISWVTRVGYKVWVPNKMTSYSWQN